MSLHSDVLHQIYDFDKTTNAFIVKILVPTYSDLFNHLDPYPIKKRDINQKLINYIEDCSNDIPIKYKVKMEISIGEPQNLNLESRVIQGFRTNIDYSISYFIDVIADSYKRSGLYILLFLVFAIVSFSGEKLGTDNLWIKTLLEGFSIGSWVFLWEAIAQISIKNSVPRNHKVKYQRLKKAPIVFNYVESTK